MSESRWTVLRVAFLVLALLMAQAEAEAQVDSAGTHSDSTSRVCPTITSSYDRIENRSHIQLADDTLPGTRIEFSVHLFADGRSAVRNSTIYLWFVSTSDDWEYLRVHDLTLLLDNGIRLRPETSHTGSVGRGYVLEIMHALVTLAQLRRIGAAKSAEGKLGTTPFKFTDGQLHALRAFALKASAPLKEGVASACGPTL